MNIKMKILKYPFLLILFCVFVFVFVVSQNTVKADLQPTINKDKSISNIITSTISNSIRWNIEKSQDDYEDAFDIESDYSFQKYLSDKILLQNEKYEPADLVLITWKYITVKTKRPYLRDAAEYALEQMSQAFYERFNTNLYVLSAYRSYKDQERLREKWCSTIRCAKIWWSEHQLWLAVDIHVANKNGWYTQFSSWYLDWMNENAYQYGFINTYSKGPKVDGKMAEIWHWRFVWIPFATELHDQNITFAERVKNNE